MEKLYFSTFLLLYLVLGVVILIIGLCLSDTLHPHLENYNETVQELVPTLDPSVAVSTFARSCFISLGGFLILLAMYGACSIILEKKSLVKGFGFITLFFLVFKLISGISMLILTLNKAFSVGIRHKVLNNFLLIRADLKLLKVQMFFEDTYNCCGIDSYRDYNLVHRFAEYPASCCKGSEFFCDKIDKIKSDGCGHKIVDAYHEKWFPLATLCLVVAAFEIIGVFLTYQYLRKIKYNEKPFPEKKRSHSSSV